MSARRPASRSGCGNGRLNEGEARDDGNIEDGTRRNDCTLAACGDGSPGATRSRVRRTMKSATTATRSIRTRTSGCTVAVCGDGVVRLDLAEGAEGFEACDDGNAVDEDACGVASRRAAATGSSVRTSTTAMTALRNATMATATMAMAAPPRALGEGVQGLVLYYNFESGAGAVRFGRLREPNRRRL